MTSETKARLAIDKKLKECGYVVQDMAGFNPAVALGVVVREFPTNSGPVDYLVFIDKQPVGVIEAKSSIYGEKLTSVAEQSKRYAESGFKYGIPANIRFAYEATDILTHFCDYADEKSCSREVFQFHKPKTLQEWLKESKTLRNRLKEFPKFIPLGFRECQKKAIINLEKSFSENKPRALIQMATGAGKTYTAITSVYRLLKFTKAKRILFLVDTKNLGEQAEMEFRAYKPNDDTHGFDQLYNLRRLNSSSISDDTKVCISTIQRMYSILCGEEMNESTEQISMNEQNIVGKPKDVVYNSDYPPEFFDFIIIDECHRSIYNLWQQVLDYFDAFLIGLTATPDNRTYGFFRQNVVSEYTHEQAVLDHVNVSSDIYLIETDINRNGAKILERLVEKRDRQTRQKRWESNDEDIEYKSTQLDRDIVNLSNIRAVIKEFKEKLPVIFPKRKEVPKTLVFAKTDSHADDIIKIIREEFGESNDFCKKITYQIKEDPKSILTSFRNDFHPRITVTVDMIATGTDVKPLECLIFMRDVKSKNYFEQMRGRGTRTLDYEKLREVSPSVNTAKTKFIIIDAVGVTKSVKTETRQIDRKPSVSMKDLMMSVALGSHDEDTLTTLAGRLNRLDIVLTDREQEQAKELASGIYINDIAKTILDIFDIEITNEEDRPEKIKRMIIHFYNPKLRDFLENARKNHDQIIDNENIAEVVLSDWQENQEEHADKVISTFRDYLTKHRDELTALQIIYGQSFKTRPLTLAMVNEFYNSLRKETNLSHEVLWNAYAVKQPNKVAKKGVLTKLVDIISIIRFELNQIPQLVLYSTWLDKRFQEWIFKKNAGNVQFTEEQMCWLRMIKDHIATSITITEDDLSLTPFNDSGGLGKFYQLFGQGYKDIIDDINLALAAVQ